jgi:hypothetical protein
MGCSEVAMRYFSSSLAITCMTTLISFEWHYPLALSCLVQFLIELVKLRSLCHDIFIDEEWRLDLLVSIFAEKVKGICDEGLVKVDTIICEEVAAVARDLSTWFIVFNTL